MAASANRAGMLHSARREGEPWTGPTRRRIWRLRLRPCTRGAFGSWPTQPAPHSPALRPAAATGRWRLHRLRLRRGAWPL